jgi:hypothetical protein
MDIIIIAAFIMCRSSPNIRTIKSIGMRWEGHVTYRGKMRNAYKILVGNLENHLRNLIAGIRIILN